MELLKPPWLIMRSRIFCVVVLIALSGLAYGQDAQPPFKISFNKYKTKSIKIKKKAPLIIPKDGSGYSDIKRRYSESPINFSGKYVVVTISCGAGCEAGWIVDATTGKMYDMPSIYCLPEPSWDDFKKIEIRRDSSLIILTGRIFDSKIKENDASRHYYKFDGNKLILIGSELVVIKE